MLTDISCVQAPSFLVLPTHCSHTKPIHPLAQQPLRPWRHQENRSSDLHIGRRRACLGPQRCTCRSPSALTLSVQFSHSVLSDSVTPWTTAHQASLSITNTLGMWKAVARLRAKSFPPALSCVFQDRHSPRVSGGLDCSPSQLGESLGSRLCCLPNTPHPTEAPVL